MRTFILIISSVWLVACSQNTENSRTGNEQGISGTSQSQDYFPNKVQVEHARHFTVSYHGNYKTVHTDAIFYPDGETTEGEEKKDLLVLVQKGTQPPPLSGELENAQLIYVPVETVAVNVQHSESFLRELSLEHRINAIGGLYSYNSEMRNKASTGEIGQIGYSWHSPPKIEVLLEREPEVFLMTLASLDHAASLEKCRQLNIPTAAVFDWAEEDYLARAEWLKFYALFFNAEEQANQVFQEIVNRIQELKDLTADIPNTESAMWGYYINSGRWVMHLTSFQAQYLRDAGLENILLTNTKPDADGVNILKTEELLDKGKEADHWMIGDVHASPLPQEEVMTSFEAWNSNRLYHNMTKEDPLSGTSDWYATAIVRPDTVLADLIKLVHPELLPDYQPVFMGMYDKTTQGKAPESSE